MHNLKIALAQLNPDIANIEENYKKAVEYLKSAKEKNMDLVVYPELFLLGYPAMDIIDRYPLIVDKNIKYLEKFAKQCKGIKVLIGFCSYNNNDYGKKYYNSIAYINDGKIEKVMNKCLLPDYAEFSDSRNFEAGKFESKNRIIEINNHKIGVIICEENWADKDFFEKPLYDFNPTETLVREQNPDILINISASPTRFKKEQLLHNLLSHCAKKHNKPLLYLNQTGSFDGIVFCGTSKVFNNNGELIARAKTFEEELFEVDLNNLDNNKIEPLIYGIEQTLNSKKEFSLDYEPDLARTYHTIVYSIKEYFQKNGFKRAVLGLSGGLDSSVCATLLADALGSKNVIGISMPSSITSNESKNDAEELAKNLGINFYTMPILDMTNASSDTFSKVFSSIEKDLGEFRYKEPLTFDNIQARSRAMILWGVSNEFSSTIPIATSDKSELYMGYATINGDMSGGFAPICDVTKTKLFALADWMNKHREIKNAIPTAVLEKPPGAELAINPKTNKPLTAEEALMPYEFLDEIIWRVENLKETSKDMLDVEFLYEKKNKISKEQKMEWLNKFRTRVQFSQFKAALMPPGPIVDSRSIIRFQYLQLISSKLNF